MKKNTPTNNIDTNREYDLNLTLTFRDAAVLHNLLNRYVNSDGGLDGEAVITPLKELRDILEDFGSECGFRNQLLNASGSILIDRHATHKNAQIIYSGWGQYFA